MVLHVLKSSLLGRWAGHRPPRWSTRCAPRQAVRGSSRCCGKSSSACGITVCDDSSVSSGPRQEDSPGRLNDSFRRVRCGCEGAAECVKFLLLANNLRAAVILGDPMHCGAAICDVLVLASEHARAEAILRTLEDSRYSPSEWECPSCGERVPGTFDLCWNCCHVAAMTQPTAELQADSEQCR